MEQFLKNDEEKIINEIIKKLKSMYSLKSIEGMARFGIITKNIFGVSLPNLRKIAKEIGKNHKLALKLWDYSYRETRLIASMIDDPELVSEEQMENWVKDFDNWEICDEVCQNLFVFTKYAYKKVLEWSEKEEEFIKRAGFALMAYLALKIKNINDEQLEKFFQIIKKESTDNRNFVKKAVNWALRQIGKRNINLNIKAIEISKEIRNINSKSAKWIANNAIKELTSEQIRKRLGGCFL